MPPFYPSTKMLTVKGLSGHWHPDLSLPNGYQHFNWYDEGANAGEVYLNDVDSLMDFMKRNLTTTHLYTHHEIFFEEGVLKQTRSSPNWEGGLVSYSTCKHHFRSTKKPDWRGILLIGLCPKSCFDNCLLYAGVIHHQFDSNYDLSRWVLRTHPQTYRVKLANTNPRGDLYEPVSHGVDRYSHHSFVEPPNHTRSTEFYKKSLGSVSDRSDGKIPKWWRDLEYVSRSGVRPPSFILSPCWLFSRPLLNTTYYPGRAVLRIERLLDVYRSLKVVKK